VPDTEQWSPTDRVAEFLRTHREPLAQRWAELPLFRTVYTVSRDEAVDAARSVVEGLQAVASSHRVEDAEASGFDTVRILLSGMAAAWARAGSTPTQVAGEVVHLKRDALGTLAGELADAPAEQRHEAAVVLIELLDTLKLVLMQIAIGEGQELIARQRQQLLELSTPVIKLWDGVVAVPLIGTLDSARSQVVMENLLSTIVDQHASVAILDITGVPTVDSLVAQHLMKTVMAARLIGAECVLSGIRPAIAQTVVQLGIDLSGVVTKAGLADALAYALRRRGVMPAERDAAAGAATQAGR
jgi:rsbT co-antagonist protein RsbR